MEQYFLGHFNRKFCWKIEFLFHFYKSHPSRFIFIFQDNFLIYHKSLATQLSNFVNHSCDNRPNWTPLSPVTITNQGSVSLAAN